MAYLTEHTLAFVLLAAILWLPGYAIERSAARGARLAAELRLPARFALGIGAWIVTLFVLASLGLLSFTALTLGAVLAAAAALWARLRLAVEERPSEAQGRPAAIGLLAGGAIAAALLPLSFLAMSPTVSWDASAYHLTLPKLFVEAGRLQTVELNVYSYWPLNVQLLYAMAMVFSDFVTAKLMHFGFGVLTLVTAFLGCKAFHRSASGWLALPLLLANGVFAYEMRVAYVDLAYAFFFLAGFLFLFDATVSQRTPSQRTPSQRTPSQRTVSQRTVSQRTSALWLAGVCCGLAAGTKINGIVGAAVLGLIFGASVLRSGSASQITPRRFAIWFGLPVLLLWIPWIVRLAWTTGNPVYPFFYGTFGGPDWSEGLGEQFQAWQSSIGMGRTPLDYLLLPLRVILVGGVGYERFDGALAPYWLILIPLALWAARKIRFVRLCLAASGLYFVTWALSSQQMRFLIPILPLLAMAGGIAIVELFDRLPAVRWRRLAKGLTFAVAMIFFATSQARILVAGTRTLGIYLKADDDLAATAVPPVYRYINQNLPADARLLFLNTNQTFFCEREALADSFFEASQIAAWMAEAQGPEADPVEADPVEADPVEADPVEADPIEADPVEELSKLLGSRRVTHVLIEHRPRPIRYPNALGELLQDPSRSTRLHQTPDGRFSLFELR